MNLFVTGLVDYITACNDLSQNKLDSDLVDFADKDFSRTC